MPLSPPPRDANGNVTPHDHPGIKAADGIIRRVSDEWVVPDEKSPTGRRLSYFAFQASSEPGGGMSVDLEALLVEANIDARQHVTTPRHVGSVRLEAQQLRSENMMVGYDPIAGNDYHGEAWGKFTKGVQKRLCRSAAWFVEIPGAALI